MSEKGMQALARKDYLPELKGITLKPCEHCFVGKGSICIETNTGCMLGLDDVRHVPDIRLNMLSVGKLDDIRHGSYFGDAKWKLTKGSLVVAKGSKHGCLYVTKTKLCNDVLNIAENEASVELWHKRLGFVIY